MQGFYFLFVVKSSSYSLPASQHFFFWGGLFFKILEFVNYIYITTDITHIINYSYI